MAARLADVPPCRLGTHARRFFTDAYDLFTVSLIAPMIGFAYFPERHGKLPVAADTALKGIALCGTLLGQVVFGVLGDRAGRKKVRLEAGGCRHGRHSW